MRIKEVIIEAGGTFSGVLQKSAQFVFAYQQGQAVEPTVDEVFEFDLGKSQLELDFAGICPR